MAVSNHIYESLKDLTNLEEDRKSDIDPKVEGCWQRFCQSSFILAFSHLGSSILGCIKWVVTRIFLSQEEGLDGSSYLSSFHGKYSSSVVSEEISAQDNNELTSNTLSNAELGLDEAIQAHKNNNLQLFEGIDLNWLKQNLILESNPNSEDTGDKCLFTCLKSFDDLSEDFPLDEHLRERYSNALNSLVDHLNSTGAYFLLNLCSSAS